MTLQYNEQNWNNEPEGGTPITAAKLLHMEAGIGAVTRAYRDGFGAADYAEVDVGESTSVDVWTNLATFGPQLTVSIGQSGTALVFVSAQMQSASGSAGSMAFDVTWGAEGEALARNTWALRLQSPAGGYSRASAMSVVTGMSPGLNAQFYARYRADAGENVLFNHRVIAVIPL